MKSSCAVTVHAVIVVKGGVGVAWAYLSVQVNHSQQGQLYYLPFPGRRSLMLTEKEIAVSCNQIL